MSAKKVKSYIFLCFCFISFLSAAQTINGVVIDAKTKVPIETATIYFDNTTKGVITNSKGEFSITYTNAIQSPLIISFLGYEKQIITDYRSKNNITILLKEHHESLDEVVINANDGLSRKQKISIFRREFLGTSKFGNSCRILNEDDIIIRYHKNERLLTAYAKAPILVKNKALQYLLSYDLTSFSLEFDRPNAYKSAFNVKSVSFIGNTYYKNLSVFNERKATKNRKKAYAGSRLKFMRALYHKELEKNKFEIFNKRLKVNPWEYFNIEETSQLGIKQVSLSKPLNILYNSWEQSTIEFLTPSISIDYFGNYTNADKVRFSGAMGRQRIGELLPFDYGLVITQE